MSSGNRAESAESTKPKFRLLVLGDGTVRTVPLIGSRWTVGRGLDATVPVRDPTVSRRHLLIERKGQSFRFRDLGTSNPVLLDGQIVRQGTLEVGQTLTIGLTRLTLERRERSEAPPAQPHSTVILSREIVDEDLPQGPIGSFATAAERVLERIEWTFTDQSDVADAAEPLLDLALNLTGRKRGWLGRLTPPRGVRPLAMLDTTTNQRTVSIPEAVIEEAKRVARPHLLTMQDGDATKSRLVIPLGQGPDGVLVLEEASPAAPAGQDLLRLSQVLGTVVWHRLQETAERLRMRDELQHLRFRGTAAHNALITSERLQDARQTLRALARASTPVLLVGEEGTEREELARYLHAESPRQHTAFVSIKVGKLPEADLATELFGDARGVSGLLQQASGGTLFLDDLQKLPRHLQQRLVDELRRTQGDGAPVAPHLVAAATSPPAADDDAYAPDLAAWLSPHVVAVPPLRSDGRDVLALAELLLSELGPGPEGAPRLLTERSKRLLVAYPWPGNVQELRRIVESAAAHAGGQPIAPRHLPRHIANAAGTKPTTSIPSLEEVERQHIVEVMQRTGGNRSRTAQILGIASSTLYEKLKRYAIDV